MSGRKKEQLEEIIISIGKWFDLPESERVRLSKTIDTSEMCAQHKEEFDIFVCTPTTNMGFLTRHAIHCVPCLSIVKKLVESVKGIGL